MVMPWHSPPGDVCDMCGRRGGACIVTGRATWRGGRRKAEAVAPMILAYTTKSVRQLLRPQRKSMQHCGIASSRHRSAAHAIMPA